jgi:ubiquinone/menaquinone biosynthesis C-methylase UbiE
MLGPLLKMKLTVPAYFDRGIWYPETTVRDRRADIVWSEAARNNAINATAATTDNNPFAKFPDWVEACVAGREGTFLDAGCGYGRVSIPLLKSNPRLRCVGVDASPVMLKKFVELAKDHGVSDRVELYCGNLDALPFPESHFEFVLSCAVLLHVPKNEVKTIIGELRRVLVNDGPMVLAGSFPNALNPEGLANIRHNRLPGKNGPVRVYTRSEVKRLFNEFASVEVEAHQMIVLPRSIGPMRLPFGNLARAANKYCSEHFIETFKHSNCFVNHHDVVATK